MSSRLAVAAIAAFAAMTLVVQGAMAVETRAEHEHFECLNSWAFNLASKSTDDDKHLAQDVAMHCVAQYWVLVAEVTRGAISMGFIGNYDFAFLHAQSARWHLQHPNPDLHSNSPPD